MYKPHVILASSSSIRAKLLHQAGFCCEVKKSNVDETVIKKQNQTLSYGKLALILADEKAKIISRLYPRSLVLGGDQIAALGNQMLKKTTTLEACEKQLAFLNGKTHTLYTACVLYQAGDRLMSHLSVPSLTMKNLSFADIKAYVNKDRPYFSCGGYYFEENGYQLFSDVHGEAAAICGMPLNWLTKHFISK
jgi:septum formation protein